MSPSLKTPTPIALTLLLFLLPLLAASSIHDLLHRQGLPVGLFPDNVKSYRFDALNGLLEVHLESPFLKQEIEERSEEIAADSPVDLDGDRATGSTTEPRLFRRYPTNDGSVLRTSWNQHSPLFVEDSAFNNSSTSLHSSENLMDLEVSSTHGVETVATIWSDEDYSDCIVEDSQESSGIIIHDDI